ncbi:MAG: hypothetical protein J1E64_02845 [Acetatifactor sp.]|nr:hypothetical protein [Acetatifactor sp.]
MKNYEKPIVLMNDEVSEGVYAASGAGAGGDCYTVTAYIHQKPETGREDYRIQVDATHAAKDLHHSTEQVLTLYFNQPVTFSFCSDSNATLSGGNGTSALDITYNYHNNANDHIGLGDVVVTSADGLAVTGAVLKCNYTCEQHSGLNGTP